MDATVKKTITKLFKRITKAIEDGKCDNMTSGEIEVLIQLLRESYTIDKKYIKTTKGWRLFGQH